MSPTVLAVPIGEQIEELDVQAVLAQAGAHAEQRAEHEQQRATQTPEPEHEAPSPLTAVRKARRSAMEADLSPEVRAQRVRAWASLVAGDLTSMLAQAEAGIAAGQAAADQAKALISDGRKARTLALGLYRERVVFVGTCVSELSMTQADVGRMLGVGKPAVSRDMQAYRVFAAATAADTALSTDSIAWIRQCAQRQETKQIEAGKSEATDDLVAQVTKGVEPARPEIKDGRTLRAQRKLAVVPVSKVLNATNSLLDMLKRLDPADGNDAGRKELSAALAKVGTLAATLAKAGK